MAGLCAAALRLCAPNPLAQEREDRTLLSHEQMRAIVNEASGERAVHHVMELVSYPRIRPIAEYQGHFRESEVLGRKRTALEFRDFLAGEFDPLPLADVMTFLRAREQAGLVRLVRR